MELNILYAAATILVGLTASVVAYLVIGWLKEKAKKTKTPLDDIILAAVHKPLVITITVVSVYFAIFVSNLFPDSFGPFDTDKLVNAFFTLIITWVVSAFSYDFICTYGGIVAEKTESEIDNRLVPVFAKIVKYVIWLVGLLIVVGMFVKDITPILAGAGIAGVAVALAAQDILGNIFGGAIIAIDKPFKVGDRIKYGTLIGDVTEVGVRTTRIKTLDNRIITIPNKILTDNAVINYALPDGQLKVYVPFSVAYGSDIKKVKKILLEIASDAAKKTPWVLTDPAPTVFFLELGESSLLGNLCLWTNNYNNEWDVQDWVIGQIDERFKKEGIETPFRQVDIRKRDGN
ncbi:MAG: mechanosensitive ion channel family protein [Methanoregula sp.]|jgi:small-conductance mechanosensitive channel